MGKRLACWLLACVSVAAAACNIKFGREGGAFRPAAPSARAAYSPEWTYRNAFAAWQANHRMMENELEQASFPRNNLRMRAAAKDAGWALKTMQANLPEGKGRLLDPLVEEYHDIGEKAVQRASSSVLLPRLRRLRSQITRDFAPDVVPIVAPKEE